MNDEMLPLYELDKQQPVAWLNVREGKLVGADPECLPRILFADVPVMMHLTCGVSLLFEMSQRDRRALEATMREVAEELRRASAQASRHPATDPIAPRLAALADRLDPPPPKEHRDA